MQRENEQQKREQKYVEITHQKRRAGLFYTQWPDWGLETRDTAQKGRTLLQRKTRKLTFNTIQRKSE